MPYPPIDGGSQLMHFTTRGLISHNINVKVLAMNTTRNYFDENDLPDEYKKLTEFVSVIVDTRIKFSGIILNLFSQESYFMERFLSNKFQNNLISILERESFDIIQLEHLYLCLYINVIRKYSNAKVILRAQNIEYVIWERYLINLKNPLKKIFLTIAVKRLKKFEQEAIQHLDTVFALTKEDAELFCFFNKETPIEIIPMGYDYEKLSGYNFDRQYYSTPVVYHLGSMDWLPNEEAVRWFFEFVLPKLKDKVSIIKMAFAGRKMPSWVLKYKSENIDICDVISNPLSYQEDKSIMIVPLRSGSGIRAKIIEGLALGKTIISTSIGAQGIEYEDGKNILIADTPDDFAQKILMCVNSIETCRKIGHNARVLSLQKYHYKGTAKKMIDSYYRQLKSDE